MSQILDPNSAASTSTAAAATGEEAAAADASLAWLSDDWPNFPQLGFTEQALGKARGCRELVKRLLPDSSGQWPERQPERWEMLKGMMAADTPTTIELVAHDKLSDLRVVFDLQSMGMPTDADLSVCRRRLKMIWLEGFVTQPGDKVADTDVGSGGKLSWKKVKTHWIWHG